MKESKKEYFVQPQVKNLFMEATIYSNMAERISNSIFFWAKEKKVLEYIEKSNSKTQLAWDFIYKQYPELSGSVLKYDKQKNTITIIEG